MDVQLVYFADCPNWRLAHQRLQEALEAIGRHDVQVQLRLVQSPVEAPGAGLHGSPTILVNGADPFPHQDADVWSCRLYSNVSGLEGAPSVAVLVDTLRGAR